MAVLNLTESRIRDMEFGSGIWRDAQVKGLLVVCHAATKTYAVQGDVRRNGRHIRTVRVKIDRVDRIGLREARNRARTIMSQIQSGIDPTAKPKETGITLLQALDEHLQEKPLREATVESYRYNVEHYLSRYKNRAVADLSRAEVRDIYQHLRDAKGQPTATGVMRTLRAVINTALRLDETLTTNPVTFLRLPTPKSRQVDELDLAEWWEKMEELSPIRRDLHRAMLLTGARRASILNVKRKDVDLDRGVLIFNHMKTGGRMLFPMGTFLRAMIAKRMGDDLPFNNPWLATWYGAAIVGGVLILIAERFDRRREPSDADVRRTASRYRQHYGADAFPVVGDHMLAASFVPDGRHRRFLKRVSAELLATAVTDEDRARAIEP